MRPIWSTFGKPKHHGLEFIEVDHAVIILIDLTDDFSPDGVIRVDVLAKDGGDLGSLDSASAILVEECEGCSHVTLVEQLVLVNSRGAPFSEVDCTIVICISFIKDGISFFINCFLLLIRVKFPETVNELLSLD